MSTPTPIDLPAGAAEAIAQQRDAFVRNVRVVMARDGVKTSEVADRMSVRYPYVWQRITGRVVPNLDDLSRLAAALHVTVEELVSLDQPTSTFIPGGAS